MSVTRAAQSQSLSPPGTLGPARSSLSVRAWCRHMGTGDADLLARIARYAIVSFVLLMAIDHVDIGGGLVQQTFLILLSGVVLALALAFGIGGRDHAAAPLERRFPQRESGPDGQ
jgi:hypothetical protein